MSYTQGLARHPVRRRGLMGLGDDALSWSGAPAADPRIAKAYSKINARYAVSNISSTADIAQIITILKRLATAAYPGDNVKWVGWTASSDPAGAGHVGFDVILATDQAYGSIRSRNFQIGQQAGPLVSANAALTNAMTYCQSGLCTLAAAPGSGATTTTATTPSTDASSSGTPASSTTPAAPVADPNEPFMSKKIFGVPVWGVVAGGIGVVGILGVVALKPRRAPVANRRRNRRRRAS